MSDKIKITIPNPYTPQSNFAATINAGGKMVVDYLTGLGDLNRLKKKGNK